MLETLARLRGPLSRSAWTNRMVYFNSGGLKRGDPLVGRLCLNPQGAVLQQLVPPF